MTKLLLEKSISITLLVLLLVQILLHIADGSKTVKCRKGCGKEFHFAGTRCKHMKGPVHSWGISYAQNWYSIKTD